MHYAISFYVIINKRKKVINICTCIKLKTKNPYFGRTLDLDYRFSEEVVVTPRNYQFNLKNGTNLKTKYAIIGMATVIDNCPLYAEAANEKGLAMAGLNFPKNSYLFKPSKDKLNLAMYELVPYFLGQYESIKELRNDLEKLNIVDTPFKENMPAGEMHYMFSDQNESIVVEQTKEGLKIYDNPLNVMTNNPTFDYHLMNINNYLNLNPKVEDTSFKTKLNLTPYGEGMGFIGLPGDNSPSSRLVRATYNLVNSKSEDDEISSVTQFFHILDSVSMVKGSTISKKDTYDLTTYTCCISLNEGIYYYKTYDNNQINAIKLTEKNMNNKDITRIKLQEEQHINYQN